MQAVFTFVDRLTKLMQVIGGVALTFIMLLTVSDVVGRFFGAPILGTYEIVGLGGAVVIGFFLPITSWNRGHITMELPEGMVSPSLQRGLSIATKIVAIAIFALIGWNLFKLGFALYKSGEVSLTRQLPFYPVAYALGICAVIQCLIAACQIAKTIGGAHE